MKNALQQLLNWNEKDIASAQEHLYEKEIASSQNTLTISPRLLLSIYMGGSKPGDCQMMSELLF